jgi:nucleoside-triphosphatase
VEKRLLLLSGAPGVGKTTVLLKTVEALKAKGYRLGGMISREVRSGGSRAGFEILDLDSGRSGWLAHVNQKHGPQVGRYRVNLEDLDGIGAEAIENAVKNLDIVVIDEIGPMELFSEKFRQAVKEAVESGKLVVSIVHWKTRNRLTDEIKERRDAEIHVVTPENREDLHETIIEKAIVFLSKKTGNKAL